MPRLLIYGWLQPFLPFLLVFNTSVSKSPRLHSKFAAERVKIEKVVVFLFLFFIVVLFMMQISTKNSIMTHHYGPKGFFVEHIRLDLCMKFQVSQPYGVREVAFPKLHLWSLITATPSGWLDILPPSGYELW